MTAHFTTAWSTDEGPNYPWADSNMPDLTMEHVLTYNILPTNLPARLENHNTPFQDALQITGSTTYSMEHTSHQKRGQWTKKSFVAQTRIHKTAGSTSFGIKSARYRSIYRSLKTPSGPKKALAAWKKAGNRGLPPQHMTFSPPEVRQIDGKSHLCITCKLEEAYPNFHIQGIFQYLDHTETILDTKRIRLAFVTLETKDYCWVVAMEEPGKNEASMRKVIGDAEYTRLGNVKLEEPEKGVPRDDPDNHHMAKKIIVPDGYDLISMWCKTEGFYQVNLYIPEGPDSGDFDVSSLSTSAA